MNLEREILNSSQLNPQNSTVYLVTKRIIDISVAIIGLFIFSPIMLIVAIAIKLEDIRGPILFSQVRTGYLGNEFKIYKFRSMYVDAEERLQELQHLNEQTGPVFKIKNDPRITKVGKFIRKTSLDELPQLVNVLKGDMSIVGPRPSLPSEVAQYNDYQKQRLLVKPGITCIWQVSGRNKIGFEEWVELDLEYIKNQSISFDIKLILKTIPVLLGDRNAS